MLYLYIYLGCIIIASIILWSNKEFNWWQKLIMIVLAPLIVAILIIGFFVILAKHIKENGFKRFWPRRKGKAYPLDEAELRYIPKDAVHDGEKEIIPLTDFNRKYHKNLTLDDVYGKGYTDSITQQEYLNCIIQIPNKYGLEANMPDYPYTKAAEALAKEIVTDNYSDFFNLLSAKPYVILTDNLELGGRNEVAAFIEHYFNNIKSKDSSFRVCVEWNVSQCRPAVYLRFNQYNPIVILFHMFNDKVSSIVIAQKYLSKFKSELCDIDKPGFCCRSVIPYLGEDEETVEEQLCCPICGIDSALLNWYSFAMPEGKFGRAGKLSICPDCAKVVQLMPDRNVPLSSITPKAFIPPMRPKRELAKPALLGTFTFETNDEYMDFYSDEELQDLCNKNIDAYRNSNDTDKGNDAAIILSNQGKSKEAISLFIELSEKGNQLAMANLFTVLWANEQEYKKATDWLKYVEGFECPSVRCLWNLAVLYYSGSQLSNNILQRDLAKAKSLLEKIIELAPKSDDKDDLKVADKAKLFLEQFDFINLFSLNGQSVHDIIVNSIVMTESIKDKGELFFRAKSISPKPGLKLGARIASEDTNYMGDESEFYFYNDKGEKFKFSPKYLNVERTEMGAWQVYLMLTAPTVMPVFWHGGYICRDFIFDVVDLEKIKAIEQYDFTILAMDDILLPDVKMSDDRTYADVYCTYWNEWEGLIREHVRITFKADGSAEASEPDKLTYYKYDCGICF